MMNRRRFLSRSGAALLGASTTCFALPGDNTEGRDALPDGSASRGMVSVRTDTAIDEGLAYLFRTRDTRLGYGNSARLRRGHIAVTSLVGLAYMAAGNQPNRGPYGARSPNASVPSSKRPAARLPPGSSIIRIRFNRAPCTATASARYFFPKCPG